jgi:hypothetical protein
VGTVTFQIKAEHERCTASLLISIPLQTRRTLELLSASQGSSLSALGRQAVHEFLATRVCTLDHAETAAAAEAPK